MVEKQHRSFDLLPKTFELDFGSEETKMLVAIEF